MVRYSLWCTSSRSGDTYEAAVQDAEMHGADKDEVITPIVEKLFVRHPFLRAKPKLMH